MRGWKFTWIRSLAHGDMEWGRCRAAKLNLPETKKRTIKKLPEVLSLFIMYMNYTYVRSTRRKVSLNILLSSENLLKNVWSVLDPWFLFKMVAHFTMRTYGVKQEFRFVEGIWLHRKKISQKIPIFHHTCANCFELPSYISTTVPDTDRWCQGRTCWWGPPSSAAWTILRA